MLSNLIYIYNSYQAALAGQGDANPEYWENKWEEVCKKYNDSMNLKDKCTMSTSAFTFNPSSNFLLVLNLLG